MLILLERILFGGLLSYLKMLILTSKNILDIDFNARKNGLGKNAIICGKDVSSSRYADVVILLKNILVLGKGPKQKLDSTILTAEK